MMADDASFDDFVRRIRAGDDSAAEELVRQFEPYIRREVRLRIEDDRLRRAFDSLDVSQSVLASFFVRAAIGQYELQRPEQLLRLLVAMARNKLASRVRRERRLRRDLRRVVVTSSDRLHQVPERGPSPSEALSRREMLEQMRSALSDDERKIAELRSEGLAWDDIAQKLGGSGSARRMQLARGIDRVGRALGLAD